MFLSNISKMKHHALLLIEVPYMGDLVAQSHEPYGEFSHEHIQYFNEVSLEALMNECGACLDRTYKITMPNGAGVSLIGVFRVGAVTEYKRLAPLGIADLAFYIQESERKMINAVDLIKQHGDQVLIYGAGAHTARLLPRLWQAGVKASQIFDSNTNLIGKSMGGVRIESPRDIGRCQPLPIVVSSYRQQIAIKDFLQKNYSNVVVTLY